MFNGRRVLVLEDELFIAMEIEDILTGKGAEVTHTWTTQEALVCIDQQPLDGAVLDCKVMNDTSAMVADRLSQRGIPFLFVTGYDSKGDRGSHCNVQVLDKPFPPCMLLTALASLLRCEDGALSNMPTALGRA